MDISLDSSDAADVWQDALDLLAAQGAAEALITMLQGCTPTSLEGGTLTVATPMRFAVKQVAKNAEVIEKCLAQAAFEPLRLQVEHVAGAAVATPAQPAAPAALASPSHMSAEEVARWNQETSGTAPAVTAQPEQAAPRPRNPLAETVPDASSKLTFERFVRGEENEIAYTAALQVANDSRSYNPLFIYGKSGLGKTHLLRSIQNYITTNVPDRVCVYRTGSEFIDDYTRAMGKSDRNAAENLRRDYADVDVLIIDDIQSLLGKSGTINFFFDTFNTLSSNGKQIVLAADRTPGELGMGKNGFDERVSSRLGSGFSIGVQVPSYELKHNLIETFCQRMRDDAMREHMNTPTGAIPEDIIKLMAERAGNNIRMIEAFCQRCLFAEGSAERKGEHITREEVVRIAKETWPDNRRSATIEDVQKCVEKFYDLSHEDLIGQKRTKNIMVARHVAIWLSRDLCDCTLITIGSHFGDRSHATVNHSINSVETKMGSDKLFYDEVMRIRESIANG